MSMATILLTLIISAQNNSPSAGMILGLTGKATLHRGTVQSNASLAELLQTGDRIQVESGNVTLLFCPTTERLILSAGTSIELQADTVRVVGGPQPSREKTKCALPQVALGKESLERFGGVRGRGNPPISLLTGGPVTTVRPVFEWVPLGGSPTYQLSVRNADDDVVWQEQTSDAKLVYPATKPALAAGLYSWEVRAQEGGKIVGEQRANFEVKPAASLSPSNAADAGAMLLEAISLENEGYFSEAAAYFRELQKTNPSDDRISRRLAWLYWNAGLIAATNEQLQKISK